MKTHVKSHRIIQVASLALLVGIIWEGAGADFIAGGMAPAQSLPQANPLLRLVTKGTERPFTLSDRQKASPLTEIRVRLFSLKKVRFIGIISEGGITVSGKAIKGKANFSVQNGKIQVTSGKKVIAQGNMFVIKSAKKGLMRLSISPDRHRKTRGEVRLTLYKGTILVTNQLRLDEYLPGIVEPELGSLQVSPEAMKAQMIAGRSYLLSIRERHRKEGYEFCDGPHCQVFGGVVTDQPILTQAAKETQGMYLSYKGRPAAAFYHHSCGGATAASHDVWPGRPIPYLTRVKDGDPMYCRKDSKATWIFTRSLDTLEGVFKKLRWISPKDKLKNISVLRTDAYGRALSILIQSRDQRTVVEAGAFRRGVNRFYKQEILMSTMFTITHEPTTYVFKGKGWGHGVGLCQAGAMTMARQGKTYQQILQHYYPGTDISRISK